MLLFDCWQQVSLISISIQCERNALCIGQRYHFGVSDGVVPKSEGSNLEEWALDEDHCRVLGACSRPGLEIELKYCKVTSAKASVLAEILGRNQGPTKLIPCEIGSLFLADGSRGNSLKSLKSHLPSRSRDDNQTLQAIAGALRENKGLLNLDLRYLVRLSDEAWDASPGVRS